jgi:hypothetical protein
MDIAWFRDLSVIILAIVVVTMVIVMGVIAIKFYRRARPIIDSVKATAANVQEISSFFKEMVVKPITCLSTFFQGLCQGIEGFSSIFRKPKEEREEKEEKGETDGQ